MRRKIDTISVYSPLLVYGRVIYHFVLLRFLERSRPIGIVSCQDLDSDTFRVTQGRS